MSGRTLRRANIDIRVRFAISSNRLLRGRGRVRGHTARLGTWGSHVLSRGRWDCAAYSAQNDQFEVGVEGDRVVWGFKGQRTSDALADIRRSDVQWLYEFLGGLTDEQIAAGLRASGGTESEIADFTKALRARLNRLKGITALEPARS